MIFDFSKIREEMMEGRDGIKDVDKTITFTPSYQSNYNPELCDTELILKPEDAAYMSNEELQFLNLCQKMLRRLGFIKNNYEFSEQFMGKSKHYYGMILSENRSPSIDALHNVLKNISVLNDGVNASKYLDNLYDRGYNLLTKRLLKYFP